MNDSFSSRLKRGLEMANMRPTELSDKTGISKSRISQYLKGSYEAKQDALFKIAKALDVSEAWLMGYDVPSKRVTISDDDMTDDEVAQWFKDNDVREIARTAAGIKAKNGDMRMVMKMLKAFLDDEE